MNDEWERAVRTKAEQRRQEVISASIASLLVVGLYVAGYKWKLIHNIMALLLASLFPALAIGSALDRSND